MPEMPLGLDLLDLEVGNGGQELRVPIDQALVLVDQAGAVEVDEDLAHGARQSLVHGEAEPRPVAGAAEPLELADDGVARLLLPLPDAADERLAPERAAVRLLPLHQLALDHHLGGDAGVIGAGLPQHVAPAHALEAHQNVLQRVVEGVPHMERARHVRGRNDNGEGLGVGALRRVPRRRRKPPPRHDRWRLRSFAADRSCRAWRQAFGVRVARPASYALAFRTVNSRAPSSRPGRALSCPRARP